MREYTDLYKKIDILLLIDIIKYIYYITLLSFDKVLKNSY